jgi:hypothetical protein
VLIPAASNASPPRMLTRTFNLSTINLSQDDLIDMDSVHQAIALGNNHFTTMPMKNTVIDPLTDKEIEYTALMKDPTLETLWKRIFGNELGHLLQGIHDIQRTNTYFFVELTNIPKDLHITYEKIVCDYKPHKNEK